MAWSSSSSHWLAAAFALGYGVRHRLCAGPLGPGPALRDGFGRVLGLLRGEQLAQRAMRAAPPGHALDLAKCGVKGSSASKQSSAFEKSGLAQPLRDAARPSGIQGTSSRDRALDRQVMALYLGGDFLQFAQRFQVESECPPVTSSIRRFERSCQNGPLAVGKSAYQRSGSV